MYHYRCGVTARFVSSILLVLFATNHALAFNQTHIRGLTVLKAPFVEHDTTNGKLKGFYVDLMDQLSVIGNFTYTLNEFYINENAAINDLVRKHPSGLMLELNRQRADFAIADHLFRIQTRSQFVDFTDPYMESHFTALVQKEQLTLHKASTFEDLLNPKPFELNEKIGRPKEEIALGSSRVTYQILNFYNEDIISHISSRLRSNPNNLVDSRESGVERTLKTPYAFIQESIFNALAVDDYCELTQLDILNSKTKQPAIHFEYGIALQKMSPHLNRLNQALQQLQASGTLDSLKRKYWNKKCNGAAAPKFKYYLTILSAIVSLSISLFLLN